MFKIKDLLRAAAIGALAPLLITLLMLSMILFAAPSGEKRVQMLVNFVAHLNDPRTYMFYVLAIIVAICGFLPSLYFIMLFQKRLTLLHNILFGLAIVLSVGAFACINGPGTNRSWSDAGAGDFGMVFFVGSGFWILIGIVCYNAVDRLDKWGMIKLEQPTE
jgi:hypothetical protein